MAFIERYVAWQNWLMMRDTSLVNQACFGIALVAAYLLRDLAPAPLREPLRKAYLIGGIPLYLFTLGVGLFNVQLTPETSTLVVLALSPIVLALIVVDWRRSHASKVANA